MAQDDKAFFNAQSPLGGRPRRDSLGDACGFADSALDDLLYAVKANELQGARDAFEELKGWIDAIDDDLCARNADGSRKS